MPLSREDQYDVLRNVLEEVYGESFSGSLPLLPLPLNDSPPVSQSVVFQPGVRQPAAEDLQLRTPPVTPSTLLDLLQRAGPLPAYSAILGICSDGLPLLFDLTDPYPGSLLVVSETVDQSAAFYYSLLASSAYLSSPEQVRFSILTDDPDRYQDLAMEPHCLGIFATYDRSAGEHLLACAEVVEQRRSGRSLGPVHLLVIDDLQALLQYRSYEIELNIKWLAKHGARSGIWALVGLRSEHERKISSKILRQFKTVVYGDLSRNHHFRAVPMPPSQAWALRPGEYTTRLGSQWVRFSLPI